MTNEETSVEDRLKAVRDKIEAALISAKRPLDAVTLIAVSKAQPIERIVAALDAGHRIFGENYVQESAGRWPELRKAYPDCEVHMIGPLQTNKAKQAVELFDCIQSVDRMKLAQALAKEMDKQNKRLRLYCQVNTGEEPQKAGVGPSETTEFVRHCQSELGLKFAGLMAIPPVDDDLALHAHLLETLAKESGLAEVSIGMSGDYETACRFGATVVRVGSAIFGNRPPKNS